MSDFVCVFAAVCKSISVVKHAGDKQCNQINAIDVLVEHVVKLSHVFNPRLDPLASSS